MPQSLLPLVASLALLAVPLQEGGAGGPVDVLAPAAWLSVPDVDARGRRPFRPDAVFARHLLARDAPAPVEGETIVGELGEERVWTLDEVAPSGEVGRGAGWSYASVVVPEDCVMMASVQGASTFFVNGDGFAGDVYRYGWPGVPVALDAGRNDVYVTGIRGAFRFGLRAPDAPLMIAPFDQTLPDVVVGGPGPGPLGLTLVNATRGELAPVVTLAGDDLFQAVELPVGVLRPLEVAKVAITQPLREGAEVPSGTQAIVRAVTLRAPGVASQNARVSLDVVDGSGARRLTYLSAVDGSAQSYAVLPPAEPGAQDAAPEPSPEPRLVLSLHGAGVSDIGQARSYSRRPGVWLAAPTNRRPFGFDWQDWGRRDAYDVRDLVLAASGVDPRRVQLTGHSMGGHGAWHLAANDTDGFSAVAPSAGWCSFDTYGGRPAGALAPLWHAADAPSRTLDYVDGLAQLPTYVLHGSKDDTVPAAEAEAMVAALLAAGGAPTLHLQEGAGHWWDGDAAAGADCVDWPGIFELFAAHPEVAPADELSWVSAGPGVDSRHHELFVEQVLDPGRPFRVTARLDAAGDGPVLRLQTENVRLMGIEPSPRLAGASLEVDGQAQAVALARAGADLWLEREAQGSWRLGGRLAGHEKRADRTGPFKKAFDRGFVFVIGTAGSEEEDAELLARARHDAQVWWYRGNGRSPLLTDEQFLAGPRAPGNVILYGNARTNAAWEALIDPARCPLRATRGELTLGGHGWAGDGLGATFLTPRRDDPAGLVGIFADTGIAGTRLGYTLAPFVSGVGYPDYAVFDASVLSEGDGGVLAAGWWDNTWGLTAAPIQGEAPLR